MDNDAVSFSARFGGVSQQVYIPMAAVLAIHARRTVSGPCSRLSLATILAGAGENLQTQPEPDPSRRALGSPDFEKSSNKTQPACVNVMRSPVGYVCWAAFLSRREISHSLALANTASISLGCPVQPSSSASPRAASHDLVSTSLLAMEADPAAPLVHTCKPPVLAKLSSVDRSTICPPPRHRQQNNSMFRRAVRPPACAMPVSGA